MTVGAKMHNDVSNQIIHADGSQRFCDTKQVLVHEEEASRQENE